VYDDRLQIQRQLATSELVGHERRSVSEKRAQSSCGSLLEFEETSSLLSSDLEGDLELNNRLKEGL